MEALGSSRRTFATPLFLDFESQDFRVLQDSGCRDVEPGVQGTAVSVRYGIVGDWLVDNRVRGTRLKVQSSPRTCMYRSVRCTSR